MGFALGLMWGSNDLSTQWQSSSTAPSFHVASSLRGGLDSGSTAEEYGSEQDLSVKQIPIISADNSSMDLLASVATGIIEVSPNLRSAAEGMDQFLENNNNNNNNNKLFSITNFHSLKSVVSEPLSLQMKSVL
jgi:hypothetical protein